MHSVRQVYALTNHFLFVVGGGKVSPNAKSVFSCDAQNILSLCEIEPVFRFFGFRSPLPRVLVLNLSHVFYSSPSCEPCLFHIRRYEYFACHLVGYRRRRQAWLAQDTERARCGKLRVSNNRKMNLIVKSEMRTGVFIPTSTERVPKRLWNFS